MINVEEAIAIHKILITQFGGASGVRDMNGLEGALNRPYFTFEGKDLYEDGIEKASAIIESIITNHPFFDGNKRLGYVLMRLILIEYDLDIEANEESKYEFVMKIASGQLGYEGIKVWIHENLMNKK